MIDDCWQNDVFTVNILMGTVFTQLSEQATTCTPLVFKSLDRAAFVPRKDLPQFQACSSTLFTNTLPSKEWTLL